MQGETYGSVRFSDDGDGSNPEGGNANRRDSMQRSHSEGSRRSTGTSFLRTVKQVQIARRIEKLAKMRSESHLTYIRQQQQQQGAGSPPTIDEDEHERLLAASGASEMSLVTSTSTMQYLMQIILGKGLISACLLAGPLALVANARGWSDTAKFWLNFITMIPLASILGDFTEEVALHTNEVSRKKMSLNNVQDSSSQHNLPFCFLTDDWWIDQCYIWQCRRSCGSHSSIAG